MIVTFLIQKEGWREKMGSKHWQCYSNVTDVQPAMTFFNQCNTYTETTYAETLYMSIEPHGIKAINPVKQLYVLDIRGGRYIEVNLAP